MFNALLRVETWPNGPRASPRPAEPGSPATVQKLLAVRREKRALELGAQFSRKLSKVMGQPENISRDMASLLPDAATARAQAGQRKGSARRIPPDARALMLCVRHVYQGGHLNAISARMAWVEPGQIHMLVKELQQEHGPDLCDTDSSLALSRAVASACHVQTTGMFTQEEHEECIVAAITTKTTFPVLSVAYGVGKSTISRCVREVKIFAETLGTSAGALASNPAACRQVLASMRNEGVFQRSGGARLFSDEEEALLLGVNTGVASVGAGMHRNQSRAVIREAAHGKGAAMQRGIDLADKKGTYVLPSERKQAKRLLDAQVGLKTYHQMKKRVNRKGLLSGAQMREKGKKAAALEHARAATNCAWLTQSMFDKVERKIQQLVEDGDLKNPQGKPVLELLEDWMLFNLDEVGCPPEGKYDRVETFEGLNHVAYLRGGTKAAYWITVCVITCANGTVMPPFVVHQGPLANAEGGAPGS